MRVNTQFIERKIADEHLLIPVGEAAMSVKGLISMSESGAMLYAKLKEGSARQELIDALMAEYEVDMAVAAEDTDKFLEQMRQLNILVED